MVHLLAMLIDSPIREKLGQRLRSARIAKGINQEEVAAGLEISLRGLRQMERGRAGVDVALLVALARLYKVSPASLLEGL